MGTLSKRELDALAAEAIVDAYGEYEQTCGFCVMIEENLSLPFDTVVLGVEVAVVGVEQTSDTAIAAVCRRGKDKARRHSRSAAALASTRGRGVDRGLAALERVNAVRYATAVRRLHTIAEACDRWNCVQEDETGLRAAFAYGPILDGRGADLDVVHIALVVGLPAGELPWGVEPPECSSLADLLGLGKAPVSWRWRPAEWPVWNHVIRRPMPIWTLDGIHRAALDALAEQRAEPFRLPEPGAAEQARQAERELAASAACLRIVRDRYWHDAHWRRAHHGYGRSPENHLWDAVDGYLDLLDVSRLEAGSG